MGVFELKCGYLDMICIYIVVRWGYLELKWGDNNMTEYCSEYCSEMGVLGSEVGVPGCGLGIYCSEVGILGAEVWALKYDLGYTVVRWGYLYLKWCNWS